MIKSIKTILSQDKEKFVVPKKVQDLIPIKCIWPDGIFKVGNKFSKTYKFSDINYMVASREDKESMLENGRYVVLLFKATQWSGNLISSEEGQMEWIKYSDLSKVKTVDDFDDLLKVMNTPELTEFQYLVSGDEWTVSIR